MSKTSREVWAVVSDLHCGSTLGLCPPDGVMLDDGGRYLPSAEQLVLWDHWDTYWRMVAQSLKPKDRLFVVINGDCVDGDHHKTNQIVSKNLQATQHDIALRTIQYGLDIAKPVATFLVRGTEAHVGQSAASEGALGRSLNCVEAARGNASRWELPVDSNDVYLDFAHHGRMGQRPWTKLTGPGTLAAEIVLDAVEAGIRAPDVVFRAHAHRWADSYDAFHTRVVQCAGW